VRAGKGGKPFYLSKKGGVPKDIGVDACEGELQAYLKTPIQGSYTGRGKKKGGWFSLPSE